MASALQSSAGHRRTVENKTCQGRDVSVINGATKIYIVLHAMLQRITTLQLWLGWLKVAASDRLLTVSNLDAIIANT